LFALHNSKGARVILSNYGAIINTFAIPMPGGQLNDIVLGFDRMEQYWSPPYIEKYPWFGCAVGRYANRVKEGKFHIDGKQFQLSRNKGEDHLHGGQAGFDKKTWQLVSLTDTMLELQLESPDAEEGYPGNLSVNIRFDLSEKNELSYAYRATTDQPTAVNLTHHSYFNLNNGEGEITGHLVKIPASHILEQDANLVATGNLLPVENTAFDFRRFKKINENWDPASGYDQSYVIDPQEKSPALVAEAYSPVSKTLLKVYSSEPVLHFYTGRWIPETRGKRGNAYGAYSGFCLETQVHPNAINIPHFPKTILRPGESYYHKTIYSVTTGWEK
jgi:aldose 1-epimerase